VTRECEYGVRLMLALARRRGWTPALVLMTDGAYVPYFEGAKVLQRLSQGGLIDGQPGPTGGYRLTGNPTVAAVLDALDPRANVPEPFSGPAGERVCAWRKRTTVRQLARAQTRRLLDLLRAPANEAA
jgi:DNA-binding IscR family transcriptional regulator